jgi:two-component system nitrogen regulation sensor histidine kinase GlnL
VGRDLESVLDALLDGVVLLDARGACEQLNAEACRILETGGDAAVGSRLSSTLGSDHVIPNLAQQVLESGRPGVLDDVSIQRRYESEIQVDVTVSPIFEGREVAGGIVVLRDRTISNSLRDMVAQQERLTSYGHIAVGIAHEVKNPLGGIRGAAELLSRKLESARQKRSADLIVREVDRITALVDDLMVFAKGERLDPAHVNLHQILDGMLELIGLDPIADGVRIRRLYDPSIPDLVADADRLTQVFLNLARNALQAMEKTGGTLSIVTRMKLDHRLASRTGRGGVPTVEVIVQDEGPGIDEKILGQLETPFFTTKTDGTGLGLAVSRHWVSRHGGTLYIESVVGEGTRVMVDLPLDGAGLLEGEAQ